MKSLDKKAIIEQLKKTPIIQVTCEKLGVSRATFYRWKKNDDKFSKVEIHSLLVTGLHFGVFHAFILQIKGAHKAGKDQRN